MFIIDTVFGKVIYSCRKEKVFDENGVQIIDQKVPILNESWRLKI